MLAGASCPADFPGALPDLSGRTVLLAGATGGLGSAVARTAAAAGAEVILLGRRVVALERLYDAIVGDGGKAALYPLDLAGAGPAELAEMVERIRADCGGLDALIVASAHLRGLSAIEHTPPDDWLAALHVNLSAPFLLVQSCLPLLRERADAAIVLAVDGPGERGKAYWGGYGVAQAGLAQLAAILADELESTAVRVHAVNPGAMRTGLRQRVWFTEDPAAVPTPDRAAAVVTALVADGGDYRGRLLRL